MLLEVLLNCIMLLDLCILYNHVVSQVARALIQLFTHPFIVIGHYDYCNLTYVIIMYDLLMYFVFQLSVMN